MSDILFEKIIKRSATWGEIRKEIYRDFMYLPEEQRNVLADLWDKLSSSKEFNLRKMKKDKSSDPRLYQSMEDYIIKQIEKDQKNLMKDYRSINGKPVKWKTKNK